VYVVCMRYSSGVFARFKKSHFPEDATRDALAWSALTKVGLSEAYSAVVTAILKHVIFTISEIAISLRRYHSRYAKIKLH
jgi:hypothetical protein